MEQIKNIVACNIQNFKPFVLFRLHCLIMFTEYQANSDTISLCTSTINTLEFLKQRKLVLFDQKLDQSNNEQVQKNSKT